MELWKKIMNKFEWIFFDLDGTLVDKLQNLYSVYLNFLKKHHIQGNSKEFDTLNGPNVSEIVNILSKKYQLAENVDELETYYEKLISEEFLLLVPKKGVVDLLQNLQQNSYKLALVTSNSKKNIHHFLNKYNLYQIFDSITFGDEVKNAKPSPDIYELCIKKNKLLKNQILVIEDSDNGIQSAKNTGLEYKKLEKDFQFENFKEVLREIESKRI